MTEKCLFCDIASGKTETHFLYEDTETVVFRDIHPEAPVHLLIVPKRHIRSINDIGEEDEAVLGRLMTVARKMAKQEGISASGYRLICNVEKGGGQMIFHLHMHLIGGWKRK